MERWYKVSLVALTAVWLVLPPPGRADPAGVGRAASGGPRQLVPPDAVVRAEVPFGARMAAPRAAAPVVAAPVMAAPVMAAPVMAVERDAGPAEAEVAGGPGFEPELDFLPPDARPDAAPEPLAGPAAPAVVRAPDPVPPVPEVPVPEVPVPEVPVPEVPVQAAVVPTTPDLPRAYLLPEAQAEPAPEEVAPAVDAAILAPTAPLPPSPLPPSPLPPSTSFSSPLSVSWPRPPGPPIAGVVPNPAPSADAVLLPRPPTPPDTRRPQAAAAAQPSPPSPSPPAVPAPQPASLDARPEPRSQAAASQPVTRLAPQRETQRETQREMAHRRVVAPPPATGIDAAGVFVVAPPERLSPTDYPRYTACVSGENVILGRSVFGNSMIVPASNRAAAIKVGLCDVIMVTRVGDAEYARRELTFMGLPADIRRE